MRTLRILARPQGTTYIQAKELQTLLVRQLQEKPNLPDRLILLEHAPVYTQGRGKDIPQSGLPNVPWETCERGGQATYHGPGQLTAYPILQLEHHGKDLRMYIHKLEEVLLRTIRHFGIEGHRIPGLHGAWVGGSDNSTADDPGQARKVASVGIAVDQWVSYHGIALNVATDLAAFRAISPCGLDGSRFVNLTDLCREQGFPIPTMDEVQAVFVEQFLAVFNLRREFPGSLDQPGEGGRKLPEWMRVPAPGSTEYMTTQNILRDLKLVTVCEEARCPNHGECWSQRTATFMIMGELCTRRCGFCAVKDGTMDNLQPLEVDEPERVAEAVRRLGLHHVVVTSVNRDDLPDMGAGHFDETVRAIRRLAPHCQIELLTPDMRGRRELVEMILASGEVAVFNHNFETVPHLYATVRPGARVERSLKVLKWAKEIQPNVRTKSGLMLGLGETRQQVLEVMDMLRESEVDVLTLGQYMRPTTKQLPLVRFVDPDEFLEYKQEGMKRGFRHVESGPLVRSSYHAAEHTDKPIPLDFPRPELDLSPPLLQLGRLGKR